MESGDRMHQGLAGLQALLCRAHVEATAGANARDEIQKILRKFGCESIGWMDEYQTKVVTLVFVWNGRRVQLKASAGGWAALYLRENPWNSRRRLGKADYEQQALNQGMIAVNSILRDWVKGQVTAIETGILQFEHVFLPHMLTMDGKTIAESAELFKLLTS